MHHSQVRQFRFRDDYRSLGPLLIELAKLNSSTFHFIFTTCKCCNQLQGISVKKFQIELGTLCTCHFTTLIPVPSLLKGLGSQHPQTVFKMRKEFPRFFFILINKKAYLVIIRLPYNSPQSQQLLIHCSMYSRQEFFLNGLAPDTTLIF